MKVYLILLVILLLLTSCDNLDNFLGNKDNEPEPVNTTTVVEAKPVEDNQTNTTQIVEENPIIFLPPLKNNLSIYIIDIEGESIVALKGETSLLINGGKESDSQKIIKNLRNLGIDKLDYVISSNAKEENIGGLPYIVIPTSPSKIYENGIPSTSTSSNLLKELYPNTTKVPTDMLFSFEDVFVKLIVPYDSGTGFLNNTEDNSIVTRITYYNKHFLFTSNCGFQCLEKITNTDLNSDVIVLDGSCDSTTLAFLQKVKPQIAIVTGELCKDTEDRFKFLDIRLLTTKNDGDIRIESDGVDFNLKHLKV